MGARSISETILSDPLGQFYFGSQIVNPIVDFPLLHYFRSFFSDAPVVKVVLGTVLLARYAFLLD
jgi:hypothetical protein